MQIQTLPVPEVADNRHGLIGMHIMLTTSRPATPETLDSKTPPSGEEFTVGVYQRTGPDVELFGFNFFTAADGGVSWNGHRLTIQFIDKADLPTIHLDLVWDEKSQTWKGLFQRGAFREQVVLRRPFSKTSTSPFVGTWFDPSGMMNNCLHIAQQQDGSLTGWSDDLMDASRVHYANGIHPPSRLWAHYGEIATIKMDPPDQLTVELRAYTPMCCSHSFTAKIAKHGTTLSGNWPPGPNQAPRAVKWKKMPGNSCTGGPPLRPLGSISTKERRGRKPTIRMT